MNGMTSAAQRAVDRLDGITRGAQHNEGNRVLVCQSGLHQQRNEKTKTRDSSTRKAAPECVLVLSNMKLNGASRAATQIK